MTPRRRPTFGDRLIRAAREALAYERGELPGVRVTYAKVTKRAVEVVPPPEWAGDDIKRVRVRMGLSQTVFADLVGASASTVRAWERGARKPSAMALRLISLAARAPAVFEDDLIPKQTNGRRARRSGRRRST
jgi:DNA-binding transcriptional regulator YiaG